MYEQKKKKKKNLGLVSEQLSHSSVKLPPSLRHSCVEHLCFWGHHILDCERESVRACVCVCVCVFG